MSIEADDVILRDVWEQTRNIMIGIRVNDDSEPEGCQKLGCCLLVTLHAMRTI